MIELGPGAVTTVLSVVVGIELAQFGYLWKINTRSLNNKHRSTKNAEKLETEVSD